MTTVPTYQPSPAQRGYCLRCGRAAVSGAAFCSACGQRLLAGPQIIQSTTVMAPSGLAVVAGAQNAGPGIVVRSLYFLCIGWWLGGLCLGFALALMGSVIGIPVGLLILNRLPQIMTLKLVRTGLAVSVGQTPVQRRTSPPTSIQRTARLVLVSAAILAVLFVLAACLGAL